MANGTGTYGYFGNLGSSFDYQDDIFDMMGSSTLYDYMARSAKYKKKERDALEDEREIQQYENMLINQLPGLVQTELAGRDRRAESRLSGYQADYPELDVSMNPARQGQSTLERTLAPWTKEQYYTPQEEGVWNKAGKKIADSEVGFGNKWGTQGKLSKLRLNPETGNYEKVFDWKKGATAAFSLYDAYKAGDIGTDDHIFKKGGTKHTGADWARFLAPALALTPYGWAGAAAVQGIAGLGKYIEGTPLDKKLRKLKFSDIGSGQNWKRLFG